MSKKIQIKDCYGNDLLPVGVSGKAEMNGNIARVDILSPLLTVNKATNEILPLNQTKNPIPSDETFSDDCRIVVDSNELAFTDRVVIAYQGASSLNAPKKGFAIDTENKHKIGEWLEMDSFHLKGYYSDWLHARDLVCNRLIEEMYKTKPFASCRPYMQYNDFDNDVRQRIDGGALCHVDGIPCELYINNEYWGLYSINIKKNRTNFQQKKNNVNHIQVELATAGNVGSNFSWANLEVRNPKKDSGNSSFVEGVTPNDGEVKTAYTELMNFLSTITSSTSKNDIEQHLNMEQVIDTILHSDVCCLWDSFIHNNLVTTWNRQHWSLLEYDMDTSFGVYWNPSETYPAGDVFVAPDWDCWTRNNHTFSPHRNAPWLIPLKTVYDSDLKSAYAKYRENGTFSTNNIMRLFREFTHSVGQDAYERDLKRWSYASFEAGESLGRIENWLNGRFDFLDSKYEYVN